MENSTFKFDPRSHLEKLGWTKGSGLGKNEHGMKEAIKVKIKTDTAGVGHDPGQEFTYHWWDHAFNEAANNINVSNEGIILAAQDKQLNVSTKKGLAKTLANKDILYGRFIKAATLTNTGDEVQETQVNSSSSDEDSSDEDISTVSKLDDEELQRVCGGRTAHKAARHGLGLSGKLARVAHQEKMFHENQALETSLAKDSLHTEPYETKKKKKSKKEKHGKMDSVDKTAVTEDVVIEPDCPTSTRKLKKKRKDKDKILSEADLTVPAAEEIAHVVNGIDNNEEKQPVKWKKRKKDKQDSDLVVGDDCGSEQHSSKKKKKRKKKEL